tara:strand:+ start:18718 stop:19575 length:858 start_codon:yes stop_codon:yes gene_type:complete
MIPPQIKSQIKKALEDKIYPNIILKNCIKITGGCVNTSYKIITNKGDFFVKYNLKAKPNMFKAEFDGLNLIRKLNSIDTPKIIGVDNNFLLLEFIPVSNPNSIFWKNFGRQLANLHLNTNDNFGLYFDNYIGLLPQINKKYKDWIEFFINARLIPQLNISCLTSSIKNDFEKLFIKLPNILPNIQPSLIHGDLWYGNFLIKDNEMPVLIDPAIYFGNREMDISMTKLFGGFHTDFYSAYNESYPLDNNWEDRIDICNLYSLLVHINMFGKGYISQVRNILSYYVG